MLSLFLSTRYTSQIPDSMSKRLRTRKILLKKIVLVICFLLTAPLALFAAPLTSTVAQLDQLIESLVTARKSDEDIAMRLQSVHLSEQITPQQLEGLLDGHPGPKTTQEIMTLALDSSQLPPPPSDIPAIPAPSAAEQADLLKKAFMIALDTFPKLPMLNADKRTLRFQNGIAFIKNTSGNGGSMSNSNGYSEISEPIALSLLLQETTHVTTHAGVEDSPANMKQKDPGGQLGQVSQTVPGLPLTKVIADLAKTTPTWLRWQTINTRQVAVFNFVIPRKQSSYKINYCCFPENEHIGSEMGFQASNGTATTFIPYKSAPGYHGELYIDEKTGMIFRLITKADQKVTDFVHQEDIRTDFEPTLVANVPYVLPSHVTILTTVVPNGDSMAKFSTRRTLFDITYLNYRQ